MIDFFKDLNLFFILGSAKWFGAYLKKKKKSTRVISIERVIENHAVHINS